MVAASATLILTGCSMEAIRLHTFAATMMATGALGHAVTNQIAQTTTTARALRMPVKMAGIESDHVSSDTVERITRDLPSSLFSASASLDCASTISRLSETDVSVEVTTKFSVGESLMFDNSVAVIQRPAAEGGKAEKDVLAMFSAIAQTLSAATATSRTGSLKRRASALSKYAEARVESIDAIS